MPRRFSEEEAQRIFALVADRQRQASGDAGLTLEELEEAARAAGLDASLVAVAAAELDAQPHAEKTLLGAPVEVLRTRLIDGPLSEDAWAGMVAQARREFGQPGMAGQIGRLREWTVISGGTKNGTVTRLTAEPTDRGTRVTLSRSVHEAVKGLALATVIQAAMGVMFGVLAAAGVESEMWIVAAILLSVGLLMGAGTQIGTRVWQRHQGGRFEALLDRLELVARDVTEADAAPGLEAPGRAEEGRTGAGRIDPGLLDDEAPDGGLEAGPPRTRTRT